MIPVLASKLIALNELNYVHELIDMMVLSQGLRRGKYGTGAQLFVEWENVLRMLPQDKLLEWATSRQLANCFDLYDLDEFLQVMAKVCDPAVLFAFKNEDAQTWYGKMYIL